MKTVIAATGPSEDSVIDRHFGRCAWFFCYDEETGATVKFKNPASGIPECKGEILIGKLLEIGANRVIAGDFGTNVQQLLSRHNIQMIIHPDERRTVSEILALLSQKRS